MARKTLNRKALREENDAAEKLAVGAEPKAKVKKAKAPKAPKDPNAKPKSRKKVPAEIRRKLYWGVFNQSMKRIALFDFTQKKQAEQKAADLSASGKSPHFVQKVKEEIQ
jgi:hypothetical protein